jgi:hypothetical protein
MHTNRLRVIHDEAGTILGATLVGTDLPKSRDAAAPRLHHGGPVITGHAVTEVEIPHEWAHLTLQEVAQQLKVARQLVSKT